MRLARSISSIRMPVKRELLRRAEKTNSTRNLIKDGPFVWDMWRLHGDEVNSYGHDNAPVGAFEYVIAQHKDQRLDNLGVQIPHCIAMTQF